MLNVNRYAVIVAGGSGTRMKTDIPKQFLRINNKPVIVYTVEKFINADKNIQLIVVLPENQVQHWDLLVHEYPFLENIVIAFGGSTRSMSVLNGLKKITRSYGVVAIHDAVRPNISSIKINELFHSAELNGNSLPAIQCIDTVREKQENGNYNLLDRNNIWLMQTPQCFEINQIKNAYQQSTNNNLTDDAAVIESAGYKLNVVVGEKNNIKITTPEDLRWMEFFLSINELP